jgi:hypothetical protein
MRLMASGTGSERAEVASVAEGTSPRELGSRVAGAAEARGAAFVPTHPRRYADCRFRAHPVRTYFL